MAEKLLPAMPTGDGLAMLQLLRHASDVLEEHWHPEHPRRGPKVPYVVYNPRERINEVLRYNEEEARCIERMQEEKSPSPALRKRVARISSHFHQQHLDLFLDRLLAQKLSLAAMQLRAREVMETSLVTETGETLADVLDRAASLQEYPGTLYRGSDDAYIKKSEYANLFPAGSFRIARHDINLRELHGMIDDAAERTHLPPQVIADYRAMYTRMVLHSRDIHAFRLAHPNDRKLFRSCFGFFPQGHIDVIQGSLSLHIRCHAIEDYAKVYVGQRNGNDATHHQMARAAQTGGVALGNRGCMPEQVRDGITLEQNQPKALFLGQRVGIFRHEEDHIYNRFFDASWMNAPASFPPRRASSTRGCQGTQRAYMRDALDVCRILEIAPRGKDEMLAQFGEGDHPDDITRSLLRTDKDSLYNFIGAHRDDIRNSGATKASPFTVGALMRERVSTPYRKGVESAAKALVILEQEIGLERQLISELLRIEPFEKWPRLARHFQKRA